MYAPYVTYEGTIYVCTLLWVVFGVVFMWYNMPSMEVVLLSKVDRVVLGVARHSFEFDNIDMWVVQCWFSHECCKVPRFWL